MKVSSNGATPHDDELQDRERRELTAQVVYWRRNYEILRKVIEGQYDDPALAWLNEIVHTRFSKLL